MSEEKLTVAELMARAAKEGHSTDAPRRRRRRSIEDGGISVAELTGSIPAVKEKPAESKHSAVKIDDPAEPEQKAEPKAEPKPEQKPEPKAEPKSEPKTPATPAAKAEQKASTSTPAPKAGGKTADLATEKVVDKPVDKPAPKAEPKLAVFKDSATDKAEKDAPARPAPSTDETIVLSIVDEKDPIRLTTGAFPVVPPSAVKPTPAVAPAAGATGEEAADAEFAAGASPADTTQMDAVTGDFDRVDATDRDGDHEDAAEESAKISVFSVLLMAIVGVVLGAAVFLAFEMLWERLSNWLVAILAVAVTLGMVGIVHALRTSRDGFSMVLAGIVGLVMTFGPLLVVF
ncbi:hypothetical protein HMPREF0290_2952 [Corynebacterium efficiens YS-314]|uniref:hypothetical protein n=1 Tax=Corynebacterium efficiens TaxID=152794 RepID=UPI0001B86B7F|nr:hypothetical protein [Corynebacterium efficiens]EEW48436.1 hypothetical protein HMPREF0290_2952 [Corynebacterium efficiens YS-314]